MPITKEKPPEGAACNRCWMGQERKVPATVTLVGAIRVDVCADCAPVVEKLMRGK